MQEQKARLEQFLRGYVKHRSLSKEEIQAVYDPIAVYHFQLQATMMEIHGYDCVGTSYFDKQYEWVDQVAGTVSSHEQGWLLITPKEGGHALDGIQLKTKRLLLREWRRQDAADLVE